MVQSCSGRGKRLNLIEADIKGSIWKAEEAFGARPLVHEEEEEEEDKDKDEEEEERKGEGEEEEVLPVQVCSSFSLSEGSRLPVHTSGPAGLAVSQARSHSPGSCCLHLL